MDNVFGDTVLTRHLTLKYHKVTAVSVNGAVGTAMSVGSGTTGHTAWYKVDQWQAPTAIGIKADITATLSFTGQYTYDDVETVASPTAITDPEMSAITASADSGYNMPVSALRGVINSSSGSGAVTMTVIQALGAV